MNTSIQSQSINIYLQKPATNHARASLVLLLFPVVRVLLDHFASLYAIRLGHLTKRMTTEVLN